MKTIHLPPTASLALLFAFGPQPLALLAAAPAFEGRIRVITTQGNETTPLLYTVGTNQLRIEVTATNRPHPVDLVDLSSGTLTLVYPHNRSFVRLKPAAPNAAELPPGMPPMPLPVGIGPQSGPAATTPAATAGGQTPALPPMPAPAPGLPAGVGPQAQVPGASAMPVMPAMPMMPMPAENMELKATGQKTNLLGRACERFELKQRGETLELWATDQLLPFRAYQRNQAPRFGPRTIAEQWPGLLQERHLFPLRASVRFDNGAERYRFEVQSIQPGPLADPEGKLFQPPPDYYEIEPLPY